MFKYGIRFPISSSRCSPASMSPLASDSSESLFHILPQHCYKLPRDVFPFQHRQIKERQFIFSDVIDIPATFAIGRVLADFPNTL